MRGAARRLAENARAPRRPEETQIDERRRHTYAAIERLVARFEAGQAEYRSPAYSEAQARTDFITPLFAALGWDIANERGLPPDLREVVQEPPLETKRPDYEFRAARQRKFFVEAKKPSVDIGSETAPAFQTRRYGFSGAVAVSLLTNFDTLIVYDCTAAPDETDPPSAHRRALYDYREYLTRFDELYDLFSRDAVYAGHFDLAFGSGTTWRRGTQFDELFLAQVRRWRELLAADVAQSNPKIAADVLTFGISRLITRLVFLRICEDRGIETAAVVKTISSKETLRDVLRRANHRYDSGIFRDDGEPELPVSDATLRTIVSELYYPKSAYTFAVVEPAILGEIYELLLGEEVSIGTQGRVETRDKPEVVAAGGVVATPLFIVEAILDRTLRPLLENRSPAELASFTVADIACGSGVFLVAAYNALLSHYLAWHVADGAEGHEGREIFNGGLSGWQLTFEERRAILTRHVYGIDIDPQAVEVATFSLLLKLIENESAASIESFIAAHHEPALPSLAANLHCGNALLTPDDVPPVLDLFAKINPFDATTIAPVAAGGFDAIVGNPPYVRIQNIAERNLYRDNSRFVTATYDNFDKYSLFIERGLHLLNSRGRLGYIVPNKFFITTAGKALRELLAAGRHIETVIDFGVAQVFGERASNYTCIVCVSKEPRDEFAFARVIDLGEWARTNVAAEERRVDASSLGSGKWSFANEDALRLFERVREMHPLTLGDVAEIFVGVQTSADDVYVIHPTSVSDDYVNFLDKLGVERTIERAITKPCLHDLQLELFVPPQSNALILWPYELVDGRAMVRDLENFPRALAYLEAHRPQLEKRNLTGAKQAWYQYGRSQSLTKFDGEKIILPILSREPRYVLDGDDLVVTGGGNGPYYLIRPSDSHSIEFLLAVLAHPLSEAIVRSKPSVFRGGYYSHGKQFIAPLPVPPEPDDTIAKDVRELIAAAAQKTATPQAAEIKRRLMRTLRERIESRISELFGLSPRDLAIAASVTVPQD